MRALLVAIALAGCGDNLLPDGLALEPAPELTIIAHQDDDLILMQPDLYDAVLRGTGVMNVYVTAGNGKAGLGTAEHRYTGLMAAYASIAGVSRSEWRCGFVEIAGHEAEHCWLGIARLSLVFLGYPDGGKDGELTTSLLHLWEAKIDRATTVAERHATYDQAGLIATLAELIDTVHPHLVRTLEITSNHGRDHSDHMVVGALAMMAVAASQQHPELVSFRGYNIDGEPDTTDGTLFDRSADALLRYAACADGCAACGKACPALDEQHDAWLRRRYAIGMRHAHGVLMLGTQCVTATAAFGDCATAPSWQLDANDNLVAGGACLAVQPTGEVTAGDCGPGAARRFQLDDEGHLWSGLPPAPRDDMSTAHALCLANTGGALRAELCGADAAPTWVIPRTLASSPRTLAGMLRLADRGLCQIASNQLVCAAIKPDGTLAPPAAQGALAIDPASLVLGDVDGDGRDDACGLDAAGVLCATTASGTVRWTALFAHDRLLSITNRKVCALAPTGIACADRDATAPEVLAPPAPDAWVADLDGDGAPDWCIAGPACGLAVERDVTTDPVPWGYAFGGAVVTPTGDLVALADLDGDGRADLCTVAAGAITCARSLAHGFGPSVTIAALPAGMTPTTLWAAGSRICAGDAARIVCTR